LGFFVVVYYTKGGWVANIALLFNIFFHSGYSRPIQRLPLPFLGIAGYRYLPWAMAIDANVLIYERIKEELSPMEENARGNQRQDIQKPLLPFWIQRHNVFDGTRSFHFLGRANPGIRYGFDGRHFRDFFLFHRFTFLTSSSTGLYGREMRPGCLLIVSYRT